MILRIEAISENVGNPKKLQNSNKILKTILLFATLLGYPQHEINFYSHCIIYTVLLLSFTMTMIISKKSFIYPNIFIEYLLNIFITV